MLKEAIKEAVMNEFLQTLIAPAIIASGAVVYRIFDRLTLLEGLEPLLLFLYGLAERR